ncbi:MAG: hypothetical protein IPH20_25040 [Bacteroidales bacterium]|nr:hypothetical protein [Bacteroidales bacterium]
MGCRPDHRAVARPRLQDDFSRRIARNRQIILKEESSLEKVLPPCTTLLY